MKPLKRENREKTLDNETKTKDSDDDDGDGTDGHGRKGRNVTGRFEACKCRILRRGKKKEIKKGCMRGIRAIAQTR